MKITINFQELSNYLEIQTNFHTFWTQIWIQKSLKMMYILLTDCAFKSYISILNLTQ